MWLPLTHQEGFQNGDKQVYSVRLFENYILIFQNNRVFFASTFL